MNTFDDLKPSSKIQSKSGVDAAVDLITENWVYIYPWWQDRNWFDRLYFNKNDVNDYFGSVRKLIDWRINIPINELKERYYGYFIIWIDKESEEPVPEITYDSINIWDIFYIDWWLKTKVIKTFEEEWVQKIKLTIWYNGGTAPKVHIIYNFSDIKNDLSRTLKLNKISLDEIARRDYDVADASFLNII